jgi:hypothetical protein
MLLPVSQFILEQPPFFAAEMEATESKLMWIVTGAYAAGLLEPIGLATNEELVHMFI